ncbi:fimbrial biogenesis chaperone [Ralstonia insidiosa]|uniref:Fimbria/pilus periplasmic chaperone n=1 Tax=Ralstonia insidiosa TaxID=190721 RepID=A0A848P0Y5_9RALS|nr:fimbria/pilus periplasmic chaperone [Ralstonia insidiosa]NMV41361.1 fimbria/pilus periplasmic chaperone [Ralstonia insidiosa]
MKHNLLKRLALACAIGSIATMANASVVITGTRVIYPAAEREVTVKLTNDGKEPALVQTWIDDGDESTAAQKRAMPFTLTPPVFRLDPAKGQTLRVTYTHEPLAADRESVYYLNVLEIPPRAKADDDRNMLQMAFRSRIKLFFRPAGLDGDANEAPEKVSWSLTKTADGKHVALLAKNPTPYHVNVAGTSVDVGGKTFNSAPGMIKPHDQREFVLPDLKTLPAESTRIRFETINDFGANVPGAFPPERH